MITIPSIFKAYALFMWGTVRNCVYSLKMFHCRSIQICFAHTFKKSEPGLTSLKPRAKFWHLSQSNTAQNIQICGMMNGIRELEKHFQWITIFQSVPHTKLSYVFRRLHTHGPLFWYFSGGFDLFWSFLWRQAAWAFSE